MWVPEIRHGAAWGRLGGLALHSPEAVGVRAPRGRAGTAGCGGVWVQVPWSSLLGALCDKLVQVTLFQGSCGLRVGDLQEVEKVA